MNKKNIIFFVGGAVIGALAGVFGTRKYFDKKYSEYAAETIDAMKEVMNDHYIPVVTTEEEANEQEPIAPETRDALLRNHEGTNYAAIYGQLHPDSTGGKANTTPPFAPPSQADELEKALSEEKDDEGDSELTEEIIAHHAVRKPRLISARAVHELDDGIDICELQFYTEDGVLADGDTEEKIHDVARLVGDCLQKYDFVNSDERTVYVMNDELDTCYEVVKIDASYEETHV